MSIAALLFPDFALIACGFLLRRHTDWGDGFWIGMEKLVYYVLFPALLFHATSHSNIDFSVTGRMLQAAMATLAAGIALGWLAKPLFRAGPMVFESGVQTAFRFNATIALALSASIGGAAGTSLMALIMGFAVPVCNIASVYALAHRAGGVARELAKNPLLLATAGGLLCNLGGLELPGMVSTTLSRMGSASIALGLIAVGAGLRLSGLREAKGMAAWFLAVKLAAMPAIGYALGRWLALPDLQLQILVTFCALPTAASAYVLAVRMGGNGAFVAFLISAGTLLAALTLPVWLAVASGVR